MITRRHILVAPTLLVLARRALGEEMPAPGKRDWAAQIPVIRIGMLGGENDADRLARYDGYKKLLETTFQIPLKLVMAADYAGAIQAFAAKQIELAYMSPAAYASAWIQSNGDVVPILVTKENDGTTSYRAAMYVRADSGITSLEQMRGKALAWSDPNSASGYLIPRAEFRAAGIDPEAGKYFAHTGFAGGHEQAVVAVLNRQYDAGIAWTSAVGEESSGYTRGVFRMMADKKMLDMRELRIIWTSRPILNGPIVLRKSTPQSFQDDMLAFHRALPLAYPDIYHAVDMGSGQGWVAVTHADYTPFIDMLQQEAAARRRR